jgi:hypothetical protein
MLTAGEAVFYKVTGCSLVEDRAGKGHYEGRSQGVSIPVGSIGGRSVRYRAGASKGHYVQGKPVSTAVDTGTVYITSRRVIFAGSRQTRECAFTKLVGFHHDDHAGRPRSRCRTGRRRRRFVTGRACHPLSISGWTWHSRISGGPFRSWSASSRPSLRILTRTVPPDPVRLCTLGRIPRQATLLT